MRTILKSAVQPCNDSILFILVESLHCMYFTLLFRNINYWYHLISPQVADILALILVRNVNIPFMSPLRCLMRIRVLNIFFFLILLLKHEKEVMYSILQKNSHPYALISIALYEPFQKLSCKPERKKIKHGRMRRKQRRTNERRKHRGDKPTRRQTQPLAVFFFSS